jgi:hypothetical protein
MAIKPVRRAGWEWAESFPQQQRAAWAECTCAGARISISLSFSDARDSSILPPLRSATRRSAWKYNAGSQYAGALSLIFTLHSVYLVEHYQVVRLEAVLLCLHVAVEPSKIKKAGAVVLLAVLGGATGPYSSLVHDMSFAKLPCRPHTSCLVPGEF